MRKLTRHARDPASGGQDGSGQAAAFVLLSTGALAEFDSASGWSVLPAPGQVFELSAAGADAVFTVISDGSVFGHNDQFGFFPLAGAGFAHL